MRAGLPLDSINQVWMVSWQLADPDKSNFVFASHRAQPRDQFSATEKNPIRLQPTLVRSQHSVSSGTWDTLLSPFTIINRRRYAPPPPPHPPDLQSWRDICVDHKNCRDKWFFSKSLAVCITGMDCHFPLVSACRKSYFWTKTLFVFQDWALIGHQENLLIDWNALKGFNQYLNCGPIQLTYSWPWSSTCIPQDMAKRLN